FALEVRNQRRVVSGQVLGVNAIAPAFGGGVATRRADRLVDPFRIEDGVIGDVPVVDAFVDGTHRDVVALVARAKFLDQPRVLDGDDRLRREAFEQLDLLCGERPHFGPEDRDGAYHAPPLHHWNGYVS